MNNSARMWCATIIVSTAMIALAIMSSAYLISARDKSATIPCMWFCTIIAMGGIAYLIWPDLKKCWDAIPPTPEQQKKVEKKKDDV